MSDLTTLIQAWKLKRTPRTGWQLRGLENAESVADHSWGTASLCLLYAGEAGVDRDRAVSMALIHDIAEAHTGDIPYGDHGPDIAVAQADKAKQEARAVSRLFSQGHLAPHNPGAPDLNALWQEYEAGETAVAVFVRDMNLVDMAVQALIYRRKYRGTAASGRMQEFIDSAHARISGPVGQRLVREIALAAD